MSTTDKINRIRTIVETKQHLTVEGQRLDLYRASAILSVYEALSPENQEKYASMSVQRMASFAFKFMD